MRKSLLFCLFCLFCFAGFAGWSRFGFAIHGSEIDIHGGVITNVAESIQFPGEDDNVYGVRLAASSASNCRIYGLALALYSNGSDLWDGDVAGLHLAPIFNRAESAKIFVWQISLL